MTTGIKVTGGRGNILSWNLTIGMDTGISLEDSSENILNGNINISNEAINIFGKELVDVAEAVQRSKDVEALAALASVMQEPKTASLGWSTLIQKFGIDIGRFSASMLEDVLSGAAWEVLKIMLKQHGIDL